MCLAARVAELLGSLTAADIDALPPVERRRFADLCRHWAAVAEPAHKAEVPEGGVLEALRYSRGQGGDRHDRPHTRPSAAPSSSSKRGKPGATDIRSLPGGRQAEGRRTPIRIAFVGAVGQFEYRRPDARIAGRDFAVDCQLIVDDAYKRADTLARTLKEAGMDRPHESLTPWPRLRLSFPGIVDLQ